MVLPCLSVNTMPLYFLLAIANWCIVAITSAGMGSTVQLLCTMHLPDRRLRK